MMTLEWPWPLLRPSQTLLQEKVKTVDFSETIAASNLKGSRSRHLIEYMKICEYWRSKSFLDLGPRLCTYKISNWIFSEITVPIWTKFCMKAFRCKEMKIWWHVAGHMTKMATTPIYGKSPSKIFFSGSGRLISTNLGSAPARIWKGQGAGAKRAQCQNKKGHLSLEPHLYKCVVTLTYDYLPSPLRRDYLPSPPPYRLVWLSHKTYAFS